MTLTRLDAAVVSRRVQVGKQVVAVPESVGLVGTDDAELDIGTEPDYSQASISRPADHRFRTGVSAREDRGTGHQGSILLRPTRHAPDTLVAHR